MTRRDFLTVGGLGAMGLSLADLAHAKQPNGKPYKAVIQLFLVGAPSQLDTWDLKPNATDEIRGPYRPIATNVPGIEIGEHFPLMAQLADKYAILRSVNHAEAPIHETGHQMMQTGYLFRGGIEYPHMGAVVSKMLGAQNSLPPWIALPNAIGNTGVSVSHGQDAGFLGKQHDAFWLNADPGEPDFTVTDLAPPRGIDPARLRRRHELLEAVDRAHRSFDNTGEVTLRDNAYQRAFELIFSSTSKVAFDVNRESEPLRQRYGYNTFGQSCLLARRLIESGVRLVTVNMFDTVFKEITWDMHANGGDLAVTLEDYKHTLCPMFDVAYSALLQDLSDRGMLDDVLVVAMGEFGRTSKLNVRGGRDHWPGVWSILMAGGGVRGGRVIGASDKNGQYPKDRPISPAEVVASVFHSIGFDKEAHLPGPQNRPVPLMPAQPVYELF